MVYHEVDICLGIEIQIRAFRQETAYKFMVAFCRTFLVRGRGFTIEDMCAPGALAVVFDRPGVGEFRTIVSETDLKKFTETVWPQFEVKMVKNIYH